ncbi:MAG: SDR family oxidoreductase [Rhodospirillaceae bacterium]|nr:SDR family oxidoreductase [Rhodospirillaceae bacterium]MBT5241388.1 SDR family oxidoreductase [Rhodospirillaceae bacterium]MBT5566580.1 SDR family oxidoreductase [Rhodospirillaceae bacterium]MBT6090669.1 SDR family oxidoreductase [Rhodospirillaceae bacterium]MBT6960150.1 SDR family oxidoreductase [Rhodospirillaceae bacterium]
MLVAGATGRTGRFVVQYLLASGHAVRGLTRNPDRARSRYGDAVEWVHGDVRDPQSLEALYLGCDRVISVLGATERTGENTPEAVEYRGNVNLIDQAKNSGLKQVIMITSLSAGRADSDPALVARFTGMQWKNKAEHYLRASNVPYTIVGPGGLRDYEPRLQGIWFQTEGQITVGTISRADVGSVMAEAARNPAALNKTFRIINDPDLPVDGWRDTLSQIPVDA